MIVITVTVVTLPVFIELLRDAAYPLPRDRHVIVMWSVMKETAYVSGYLVTMKVMTLVTLNCGCFLDGGGGYVFHRRWIPSTPLGETGPIMVPVCRLRF